MKIKKIFLITAITFGLTVPALAVSQPSDIKNHWAASDIKTASDERWVYIENSKFAPDKSASREEVVWMLIGACQTVVVEGFDLNNKADLTVFKDKSSDWAKERMAIAIGNGYIQGYSDKTIKAQANITRAEFAVMLSRLMKDSVSEEQLPFSDKIPDWAMDGIKKAYGKKIVTGYIDKTFKPDNNLTKAEALVMIKRWKEGLQKAEPICDEYKKILSSVNYTSISPDHFQLSYYGKEGKASSADQGKYFIGHGGNNFFVKVNDFSQETLDSLANSLKILIPDSYEKVLAEIPNTAETQIKEIADENKEITVKRSSNIIGIAINADKN